MGVRVGQNVASYRLGTGCSSKHCRSLNNCPINICDKGKETYTWVSLYLIGQDDCNVELFRELLKTCEELV